MKRKPRSPGPTYRPMNWFDRLWWHRCLKCNLEFRREPGWKAEENAYGATFFTHVCHDCAKTAEEADKR